MRQFGECLITKRIQITHILKSTIIYYENHALPIAEFTNFGRRSIWITNDQTNGQTYEFTLRTLAIHVNTHTKYITYWMNLFIDRVGTKTIRCSVDTAEWFASFRSMSEEKLLRQLLFHLYVKPIVRIHTPHFGMQVNETCILALMSIQWSSQRRALVR